MNKLQNSNAFGQPDKWEWPALSHEVTKARAGQIGVRLVIGVGETNGRISFRVLGYAKAVLETIRLDVSKLVKRPPVHLHLFSSATKLSFLSGSHDANTVGQRALPALVALAEALRIVGYEGQISLDLAAPQLEVPLEISKKVYIPTNLENRLQHFQEHNKSNADCRAYAIEHAPMFEDFGSRDNPCLRIFIGGRPEGVFWVIRRAVRTVAVESGLPVNPMLGLVMFGLKRPWYHAHDDEPVLGDLLTEPVERIEENMKNLSQFFKRETVQALKFLGNARVAILAQALSTHAGTVKFACEHGFKLSPRIQELIKNTL
jgi:hypothetical protein